MELQLVNTAAVEALKVNQPDAAPRENQFHSQAEAMKNIRKARLQRQVLQDPGILSRLVALETTSVYNAKGDLVQAVSGASLEA